nr:G protein-coupled receptor [Proales similis]
MLYRAIQNNNLQALFCLLAFLVPSASSSPQIGYERNTMKILHPSEADDGLNRISQQEQERRVNEEETKCFDQLRAYVPKPNECPMTWDTVICWPPTHAGKVVKLPCPDYIDLFNLKSYAYKKCIGNGSTESNWSRTYYEDCQASNQKDPSLQWHVQTLMKIEIFGYVISLFFLSSAILVFRRRKFRCPRNDVHVNLFTAFIIRTLTVLLVAILRSQSHLFGLNNMSQKDEDAAKGAQTIYYPCRLIIVIFRYFLTVYHVAIFSEALYLTLLLVFPYYSERKGSKFCIMLAWLLPFVWMIPWIVSRFFFANKWCWHEKSLVNLIIDIPHTLLLIMNAFFAIVIFRVLFSKMTAKGISMEKVKKYRRLAKSILIIIPILGLHFILFEWLSYLRLFAGDEWVSVEITFNYFEAFCNSLQGPIVSFFCCFIQKEARVELCVIIVKFFEKLGCSFRCLPCANAEQELIYGAREERSRSQFSSIYSRKESSISKFNFQRRRRTSMAQESRSFFHRLCSCISSTHKNDFYQTSSSRRSNASAHDLRSRRSRTSFFSRASILERLFPSPKETGPLTSAIESNIDSGETQPISSTITADESRVIEVSESEESLYPNRDPYALVGQDQTVSSNV